jgi:hypothetical protein
VREHIRTPQPSEKRGRRRRGESVQIFYIWPVCLQAGGWSKYAWIGSKLGEPVLYFDYFNLVTQFGIWVRGDSDLRAVLSVQTAAVSAQISFGRQQFG